MRVRIVSKGFFNTIDNHKRFMLAGSEISPRALNKTTYN